MTTEGLAVYRLPYADHYIQLEGTVRELRSCTELHDMSGFVVAPFETSSEQPIVLISPQIVIDHHVPVGFAHRAGQCCCPAYPFTAPDTPSTSPSSAYAIDFANFHAQICKGVFTKIVLSRCACEPNDGSLTPQELFLNACRLYPRLFIALVSTPQTGTWLTASPEILVENTGSQWHTVALAGTMKLQGEQLDLDIPLLQGRDADSVVSWSTKDIREQRLVATYIAECLEHYASDFTEEGPRTVRAANLAHLRSDFFFSLDDDSSIGSLLQSLHPTPAVCGLPKREALNFIGANEHSPRRYYTGFMGPIDKAKTHLYVTLRCMNITPKAFELYAGGGLLAESRLEQEWLETEAKLETMRTLIY